MAYVSQEDKKELAPAIKAVLKKFGMKGSIGIRHHSSLVVKLKSGEINFIDGMSEHAYDKRRLQAQDQFTHMTDAQRLRYGSTIEEVMEVEINNNDINEYWIDDTYRGVCRDFLNELLTAMKGPKYFCEDDIMTDYFHRSHYTNIVLGKDWKTPYTFVGDVKEKE